MRAVFDLGESEDSNTLLVASVNLQTDDREEHTPTPRDSQDKEVVSLPRSRQPPQPSQLPVLVAKTSGSSTLSKSESCLTVKTISVSGPDSNDARSVSVNQLSVLVNQEGDHTDTGIAHQTGTSSTDQMLPQPAHHTSVDTQPGRGMKHSPKACSSCVPDTSFLPRQETMNDLFPRHPRRTPSAHATFSDGVQLPGPPAFIEPCGVASKARILGGISCDRMQEVNTGSSDFTGSPPSFEPQEAHSVERVCVQTVTSLIEEGEKTHADVVQNVPPLTDTPVDDIGGSLCANKTKTEAPNSVLADAKHVQKPVPIAPRSPRLAAKFDVQTMFLSNTSNGIPFGAHSPSNQSSRPHVHTHTTQLPTPQLQQSDASSLHITQQHRSHTNSGLVGQTIRDGQSEQHLRQINPTDEPKSREGLAGEKGTASHEGSQKQTQSVHARMPDCVQPIATASAVTQLCPHPSHKPPIDKPRSQMVSVTLPSGHMPDHKLPQPVNSGIL